jgi:hypothetical protein
LCVDWICSASLIVGNVCHILFHCNWHSPIQQGLRAIVLELDFCSFCVVNLNISVKICRSYLSFHTVISCGLH